MLTGRFSRRPGFARGRRITQVPDPSTVREVVSRSFGFDSSSLVSIVSSPPSSAPPVLRVERLSYQYPGGRVALADVSLSVGMGEVVGLVGPNGAGKTTLLLHFNGLLPGERGAARTAPEGPAVEVLGMPVVPANFSAVRREVGLLFQDPDDQLFCPTVREDVAFGPLQAGLPRDEVLRRVRITLAEVGLDGFDDRRTQELSMGERRRVCLAGVLACEPSLLALDEPTSNLDPRSRRGFIDVLRRCAAAQVIATHDLELILDLCHRVLVLDAGRIQAVGSPDQILGDERLMLAHGLEVPLSLRYGPVRRSGIHG